jgi:hypothetical protein
LFIIIGGYNELDFLLEALVTALVFGWLCMEKEMKVRLVVDFLELFPDFLGLDLFFWENIHFGLGNMLVGVVLKYLFKEVNRFVLGTLHYMHHL